MKKALIFILCIIMLLQIAGCKPGDEDTTAEPLTTDAETTSPGGETEINEMKDIEYEMTKNEQKQGPNVELILPPASSAETGVRLTAKIAMETVTDSYNYCIVDWGDGTWSYNGPYANKGNGVIQEAYHTYKKAGEYSVKACSMNTGLGKLYGWTAAQTLKVKGDDYKAPLISGVTTIGSTSAGDEYGFDNIKDGDNKTMWRSAPSSAVNSEDYIGYLFDGYYTLDLLEIKFPSDAELFPSNISVEYTTDGGETWYMLPHYYYALPNSEGEYACVMNFPNPSGATLSLPLDKISANGIRFRSLTYPVSALGKKSFSVQEIRVYGVKGTLLYTSYDEYYNADLSNMWAIFGTAKTEPMVNNSLRGAAPNGDPFRSGMTMIASTEWAAWNGAKLNWSGFADALSIHVNALKNSVYGGDGWYYDEKTDKYVVDTSEYDTNPRDDGFVWATETAPQHLDAQNHYTNNSVLIIASRDYLLTGNGTEGFLSSVNSKGQVMLDKLRKAMEYMLENLNGKSGMITIYDPRNDGTVRGMASNYWDSLNFFGYNSAYENVLFYQSVLAMSDIEYYVGNAEKGDYYISLADKIKTKFNDFFWDNVKGRYITSVNIKGDVLDFGITFVNFMAVSAGLASEEQAQQIYGWVDGKRIIETDTSKGDDIYNFKVSARSNTVAIETVEEDGLHYWWYNGHSFNDVLPGHWGQYGLQMQNGGTIFYTSYYDISGRTFISGDNAISRFNVIMEEFHKDQLRRDPRSKFGGYRVSILGEFPESGLVPLTFVTDIVGITPELKGLKIQSCLPSDMSYAGVSEYNYGGRVYHIEVNKELSDPVVTLDGDIYTVKFPADRTFYITLQNKLIEE